MLQCIRLTLSVCLTLSTSRLTVHHLHRCHYLFPTKKLIGLNVMYMLDVGCWCCSGHPFCTFIRPCRPPMCPSDPVLPTIFLSKP
ncbi:hypothetical protein F4824DRAFT_86993 [Ustulina deusta]|nr:hypothetical protein F4824DRAFT_86993 [Ustulina deusta]